jgi:hypothetical protein
MKITKILGLFGISLGIALFSYLSVGMVDYGPPVAAILFGAVALLFTGCFFGYLFEIKITLPISVKKIILLIPGAGIGIGIIFYLNTNPEVDIENLVSFVLVGCWITFEIWGGMDFSKK